MDLELRMREAVAEQEPGDEFTARVMAAVNRAKVIDLRSRKRSRIILLGVLLSVGAAAAALVAQLTATDGAPRGEVAQQQAVTPPLQPNEVVATDKPASIEEQLMETPATQTPATRTPATQTPATQTLPTQTLPTQTLPTQTPPQSSSTAAPMDGLARIVLLVKPVADRSGAPGARQTAEAFRAQLVRDFHGISDLVVLESTGDSSAEASADFNLTVSSLEWRRPTPGSVEVISTDGGIFSSGNPYASGNARQDMPGLGTEYWPLEARFEEARSASSLPAKARDFTVMRFSDVNGVLQPETPCSTSGSLLRSDPSSLQRLARICNGRSAIASGLAEVLRQRNAPDPVAQTPVLRSESTAVPVQPGLSRRPTPEGLRIYQSLMGIADTVERLVLNGKPSGDNGTSLVLLGQVALNDEELVKLDKYLRPAIQSDRENQAKLSAAICSRKTDFRTLDELGMAMNELSSKTQVHQENLGLGAEAELGPELFLKVRGATMRRSPREMTTYDFPELFRAQQRDLQTELDRVCSSRG